VLNHGKQPYRNALLWQLIEMLLSTDKGTCGGACSATCASRYRRWCAANKRINACWCTSIYGGACDARSAPLPVQALKMTVQAPRFWRERYFAVAQQCFGYMGTGALGGER
jgi:hypothetical protein